MSITSPAVKLALEIAMEFKRINTFTVQADFQDNIKWLKER